MDERVKSWGLMKVGIVTGLVGLGFLASFKNPSTLTVHWRFHASI